MSQSRQEYCPECEQVDQPMRVDRRQFVRRVGQGALAVTGASLLLPGMQPFAADKAATSSHKPGEDLVRELHASMSAEQRTQLILPWDHGSENGTKTPTRLGMFNRPVDDKRIKDHYTKPQQELIERILRAISSGDEGYDKISRGGTFDGSESLDGCGAVIFGDPGEKGRFSWVFSGHHLTVRCDGNSEPGAAFGGPMYYGHSPNGYSDKNIFNYQTKRVLSVYEALDGGQRERAIVRGSPGEHAPSIRFRPADESKPGISYQDLSADQRQLVEQVMRAVLSPYRQEDVDEVLEIVKANGGMEKIHLAFYEDGKMRDGQRWHFWRLEGPGFVWNYRVLPHVHTYVHIAQKA